MATLRILVVIPHYYQASDPKAHNRSLRPEARVERANALATTIMALRQTFPAQVYGLDHQHAAAWQMVPTLGHHLDVVVCTTGEAHLLEDLKKIESCFFHHGTSAESLLLGFECHKVIAGEAGKYDYYVYLEDDIALTDPLFFRKRWLFDRNFDAEALLQPNRYEMALEGPIHKLYVDYHIRPELTASFQNITDQPNLCLPFLDETVLFERTTYPSAGCFVLNAEQLKIWSQGEAFQDKKVAYLSPLDSAATLSVMRQFRIYKPVLDQADFLEVRHLSPRWIRGVEVKMVPRKQPFDNSLRHIGHS